MSCTKLFLKIFSYPKTENYFIRGGIWGGVDGLSLSLAIALNSYLKYAKLLEYQRDPKVLENENFDSVW